MRRHATPASSLPSFMLPCPDCGGQMIVTAIDERSVDDFTDITHRCTGCGGELTRTIAQPRAPDPASSRARH